jgi:hypothetical protein
MRIAVPARSIATRRRGKAGPRPRVAIPKVDIGMVRPLIRDSRSGRSLASTATSRAPGSD